MRYLLIDTSGDKLSDMASVKVHEFRSNPEMPEDGHVPQARTDDVEEAISALVERHDLRFKKGEGSTSFVVVPLADAYTVNAYPKSSVQVSSTGGLP